MNRVLVVGSLHYDIVIDAPHLPGVDETVMGGNVQFVCGGKGGNQAVAASRHGTMVSFAGQVGEDFFATALLDHLKSAGVDTAQIQRGASASGMSVAVTDSNGDYGAVVASGANQHIDASQISVPDNTRILILQNEIPEATNVTVARQARERGAQIILNAAPMRPLSPELLAFVDILIVNRVEAEALLTTSIDSVASAEAALSGTLPAQVTIITLGADGLVYRDGDAEPKTIPPTPVQTASSHGAGDAFVGALAAELAKGEPLTCALASASEAAALWVSTPVTERDALTRRNE